MEMAAQNAKRLALMAIIGNAGDSTSSSAVITVVNFMPLLGF